MVVLYGGFVCENVCKRNLRGSNPRALAVDSVGIRMFHRIVELLAGIRGVKALFGICISSRSEEN